VKIRSAGRISSAFFLYGVAMLVWLCGTLDPAASPMRWRPARARGALEDRTPRSLLVGVLFKVAWRRRSTVDSGRVPVHTGRLPSSWTAAPDRSVRREMSIFDNRS